MDTSKLILLFLSILLFNSLFSQCDVEIHKCFTNLNKSKTINIFVENLLPNEPQKQKIYLYEGYFYTFSYCISPGLGEIILGLHEINGTLIKNNIINSEELKTHFEWYCKKTGFYHLIYWLHEGAGCIAVQVSMHPKPK